MIKIIAPAYQHDILSKLLLKDNDVVVQTQILPLRAFISEIIENTESNYDDLIQSKLFEIAPNLKILQGYINNDGFIKSIKNFHIDMYLYDISVFDLAKTSLKDQDLITIFSAIYDILPDEIISLKKLEQYLINNELKDVFISEQTLSSNYLKSVVKLLKDHGVKTFEAKDFKAAKVELFYANNKRSEIEASAQMIVDKKMFQAQIIVLDDNYLPLIQQIYTRYNINFSMLTNSKNNSFHINFIKLIKLIEEKSVESVVEFLSSNPLNLENITSLIRLNDMFNFDLKELLAYEYVSISDSIVHPSNLAHYKETALKAMLPIKQLRQIINDISDINNKELLLTYFFNMFLDSKEKNELRTLRSVIIKNKDQLIALDIMWPLLEQLLLKKSNNKIDLNNIVVCNSQNHYYFNKEDVIILGATANNYPKVSKQTGVIDEKYLESLNYPKKADRFNEQLMQQESIFKAKNISIFYPLSSYEGKAIEPSFMLVNFAKQFKVTPLRYQLIENDPSEFKRYKLDKHLAQKLFFKEGKLNGSISSFEGYNNCNYSYFLKSGLKLYPKQMPELSYGYIGSIIHEVMETVTNRQIENKPFLTDSELSHLINDLAIPLEQLNPKNGKIPIVKALLIRQMRDVLSHLKDVEADTNFKPISSEAEFYHTINNNINIKGYVDRTDQYLDSLRVIDFKSSDQNLSEKLFKQGLQLQLITYLLVMSEKYQIKPAGAFYHTMRTANTNVIAGTAKKTKDMFYPLTDTSVEENYLQNNRLNGWHFKPVDNDYGSKNYVGGLSENKAGLSVYGQPKNFETVATILEKIYSDIYNDLSNGIIDCIPINNPCAYCDYHSICLSKSTTNFKEQIFTNQKLSEEINHEMD